MDTFKVHLVCDNVFGNFERYDGMENLRMSRETFHYLCDQLRRSVLQQNTRMRTSISTEHRVAIKPSSQYDAGLSIMYGA